MVEQRQTTDDAVKLVDAGVPADQGLSSLALLMQLAGNLFAAAAAMLGFALLFALRGSGETLCVFLIFVLSIVRSLFHRAAGTQLLYGGGGADRMAGIRHYLVAAGIHTVAVSGLLVGKLETPTKIAGAIAIAFAVWPVTLAILMALPRFKRFKHDLPSAEDKGFEGASILMTVLGVCGLVGTGAVLLALLDMPGRALSQGSMMFVVLAVALLFVRSLLHVQAGLSGLRETNVDRSVELANRYANFGVISSFSMAGALLMLVMSTSMKIGALVSVCGVCWVLMTWPLVVRRFFSDRQFEDLLAGDGAPTHRRAPDAGLTGLGWLLFAHAMLSASFLVIELLVGSDGRSRDLQLVWAFGGAGSGGGLRSIWWNVGVTVLQAWAGYELVRMSPQSRVIAIVFGIVGAAVTVYVSWPVLQHLDTLGGLVAKDTALQIGPFALSLIIPVATLVLVNRKIAPTARARFRTPPTTAPKPVT